MYSEADWDYQQECPAGYYCDDYTGRTECLDGQYSSAGSTSCTDCPIGSACPDKANPSNIIDCEAEEGFYALNAIQQTECIICEAGYICPSGSNTPEECPAGTFSLPGASWCTSCPEGM